MVRLDASWLYSTGHTIHPLEKIKGGDDFGDWVYDIYIALSRLEGLLQQSVYRLKTSQAAGRKLMDILRPLTENLERTDPVTAYEAYQITSGLQEFENVLNAELGLMDIYMVLKKRGYDTTDLILNGYVLFPDDLPKKAPEALTDIVEGCRCIAFELPTAAGFHLHRANESVMHRYYDAVTGGAARPPGRNIGDYLKAMRDKKKGDKIVLNTLQGLKDLHRNPLIHPEHSLENVDEAIALLGSIQSVVVHMLKAIPELPPAQPAQPATTAPPNP